MPQKSIVSAKHVFWPLYIHSPWKLVSVHLKQTYLILSSFINYLIQQSKPIKADNPNTKTSECEQRDLKKKKKKNPPQHITKELPSSKYPSSKASTGKIETCQRRSIKHQNANCKSKTQRENESVANPEQQGSRSHLSQFHAMLHHKRFEQTVREGTQFPYPEEEKSSP